MTSCGRVILTAIASGSGKTTLTCGILKALKDRGLKVAALKCGPDYIDPLFHSNVIGLPSRNVDPFFTDEKLMISLVNEYSGDKDIIITEGVMGYYDGLSMTTDKASTYQVAKTLKSPVILIVNAKGMALSLIPLIKGFMEYREDSNIKGIILNNISEMTYNMIAPKIEEELKIKALGFLPHDESITIDSRHLGLVTPDNVADLENRLDSLGKMVEKTIDLENIIDLSKEAGQLDTLDSTDSTGSADTEKNQKKIRIGIARDEAFCFYYEDNLNLLRRMGVELVSFSPLHDKKLPEDISGIILGGGYPELYAGELSENKVMLDQIKSLLDDDLPCLAECGGFMYLHKSMEDKDKVKYQMVGFLEEEAYKCDKLVRFGYIEVFSNEDNDYLMEGGSIKGHEFHYWDSTGNGDTCKAIKPSGKRSWDCIHQKNKTFMGFPHLYYYSNPDFAKRFVGLCQDYSLKRR